MSHAPAARSWLGRLVTMVQRIGDETWGRVANAVRQVERWVRNRPPHQRQQYSHETQERWGKLDGTLNAGSSATVSLWKGTGNEWYKWDQDSGDNVTAYAPPYLPSGRSVASGKWVLVRLMTARWTVIWWEPEVATVLTDYQVDGTNEAFQKKERANAALPFADAESSWTTVHTGTDCVGSS